MHKATKLFKALKEGLVSFDGAHNIYTPQALVEEILSKINLNGDILVMFNIEFVVSLVYTYNINPDTITFYSDHQNKSEMARRLGVKYIITTLGTDMQFDVVVGNPPYQDKKGNENSTNSTDLATQFVYKSFDLSRRSIALIIPSDWVGPNTSNLKKFLFTEKKLKSLALYGDKWFREAKSTCAIVYDKNYNGNCEVVDITGNSQSMDLSTVELLAYDNVQTNFIQKFNTAKNLGSRWLRGSLHLNKVSQVAAGVEFICAVGKKDDLLTTQMVSPLAENTGANINKLVISNVYTNTSIGNIKLAKKSQVGGHSVVFLTGKSDEELLNLKAYLESKVIKLLIKSIKTSSPNSKSLFKQIPEIPLNKTYTDSDLYQYFGFTQQEIDYIESNS